MNQTFDIPYLEAFDPLRSFDVHVPRGSAHDNPILVFVHGGAWRSGDKADHRDFASKLAEASGCPVLVPNYRLTPGTLTSDNQFEHPGHAEDILAFLNFLVSWGGISDVLNPDGRDFYLLGHSAGAHILSAILLDSSAVTPSLTPPPALLRRVAGAVMSEGIYDIDMLLARFPEYRQWFIAAAFGERESYADVSVTRLPLRRETADAKLPKWLIVHSTGDTLVDTPQSEAIYTHLYALYGAEAAAGHIQGSLDELHVEHDDVLRSPGFIDMVCKFVDSGRQ